LKFTNALVSSVVVLTGARAATFLEAATLNQNTIQSSLIFFSPSFIIVHYLLHEPGADGLKSWRQSWTGREEEGGDF